MEGRAVVRKGWNNRKEKNEWRKHGRAREESGFMNLVDSRHLWVDVKKHRKLPMSWQMMWVQGKCLEDINVLALCSVSCSLGKLPSPNEGKICPFPSSLIGEVLTTLKRIWKTDAKYAGIELLWRGVGDVQANSCTIHVLMDTSKSSQGWPWEANFLQLSYFCSLSGHQSRWVRTASSSVSVHMGFWAHPPLFPVVQNSVMNIRIRTWYFIAALAVTLTNRSGVNPHDGSIENNHSATLQLSAFALEELLVLQSHLGGRLLSCPQCKGWGCFVGRTCWMWHSMMWLPTQVKAMLSWFN